MVTPKASIIAAGIVVGLASAAGALWGYFWLMKPLYQEASVEIEQMPERSWGVEVTEMTPAPDQAPAEDKENIVVARGE